MDIPLSQLSSASPVLSPSEPASGPTEGCYLLTEKGQRTDQGEGTVFEVIVGDGVHGVSAGRAESLDFTVEFNVAAATCCPDGEGPLWGLGWAHLTPAFREEFVLSESKQSCEIEGVCLYFCDSQGFLS